MKKVNFQNIECVEIVNERLTLLASVSVGPRVLSLKTKRGENLFAELPDLTLDCPGVGPFHLYGGHRLWYAPEEPSITYLPDDSPVQVDAIENGVHITQDVESQTGIRKELEIRLIDDKSEVEVQHTITNEGGEEQIIAPWAITQCKPGGVGILPLYGGGNPDNATLPDRSIVLWPYTDVDSSHITWGNRQILVRANMQDGSLKIGFPNPAGWIAYWIGGTLFVKRADFDSQAAYFDFGSSSECYCNPHFIELETLAPITKLGSGERVEHIERWQVYEDIAWEDDLKNVLKIIQKE
jgi:hypothetical protein